MTASTLVFVQMNDPGKVGKGSIWVDTSAGMLQFKLRNVANKGWDTLWSVDANPFVKLALTPKVPAMLVTDSSGNQALRVLDAPFAQKPHAAVSTGLNTLDDGEGAATFAGPVAANGGVPAVITLDPATCTPAEIANALNLLGFTKAPA